MLVISRRNIVRRDRIVVRWSLFVGRKTKDERRETREKLSRCRGVKLSLSTFKFSLLSFKLSWLVVRWSLVVDRKATNEKRETIDDKRFLPFDLKIIFILIHLME
jgi:hypothetical protein